MSSDSEARAAIEAAAREPGRVELQIRAAYACDRAGDEATAAIHYDAAWALGVPAKERREFLVGYGSTLRNVGRVDESALTLTAAVSEFPDFAPLHAFLALALHDAGRHREAMAAALTAVLKAAEPGASLGGYERALALYRDELATGAPPA